MGKGKKKGKRTAKKNQNRHPGRLGVPQYENKGEPGNCPAKEVNAPQELRNPCENAENNDKVIRGSGSVLDQKSANEPDSKKAGNDFFLSANLPTLANLPPGDCSKVHALDMLKKDAHAHDELKEEEKSSSEETSTAETGGHGIQKRSSINSPYTAVTSTAAPADAITVARIDASNMQASEDTTGKSPIHPIGASMHPDGGILRFSSVNDLQVLRPATTPIECKVLV